MYIFIILFKYIYNELTLIKMELLRACGKLWSAREMVSVALSVERDRRIENVFHMLLRGNFILWGRNGHFIDFIKERWINVLKFGFAYMFLQVLWYMKQILIDFLETKWQHRISRKQIRFFWTASSAGPLPVTILYLQKKKRKIHFISLHFIFIYIFRIFLVFCSRCKIATGSVPAEEAVQKKNGFFCERFCAAILFSKNLLKFVSCTLTLVETCMQNQISVYLFIFL